MFREKNYYKYPVNVKSGPDEFILTELFNDFSNITINYNCTYNYTWNLEHYKFKFKFEKKVLNFRGIEKPWEVDRDKYDDIKEWWKYADEIEDLDEYIVKKKYIDKSVVYFYHKNKETDFNKDELNRKGFTVTLISFEEELPHEIYDKVNIVCKMKKDDEIKCSYLLTQFREVYLHDYNMMLIKPSLDKYIK
jgi:hypothetical protein